MCAHAWISAVFFFFFFFSLTSLHSGSLSMHSRCSPLNRMFCYGYQVLSWTTDEARRSIFTASRSTKPINLLEALWQNRNIVFTPCRMESLERFFSVCVPVSVLLWFMCKLMDFNIHKGLPADSSLWVPPLNQCHDNMSRMFIVKKVPGNIQPAVERTQHWSGGYCALCHRALLLSAGCRNASLSTRHKFYFSKTILILYPGSRCGFVLFCFSV